MNYRILKYKISLLIVLLTLLTDLNEVFSQSQGSLQNALQCEYLAKNAEKTYGLPENILLSISRVESGYHKVDGITRAWPWTLNAGGDSAYFKNKATALNSLEDRIKTGVTNIDIGCMQLNYRWHKKFFNSLSEMMNPKKNVDYGARFLKKLYQRHGSWEKAVKYYHSSKSKFNVRYYKKVQAVWKRENDQSSLKPQLVAVLKPETKKINILKREEEVVPLIEINKSDQVHFSERSRDDDFFAEKGKPLIVSTVNFQKTVDTNSEFNFTSFVKNVGRKNTALPKYIRDNWTIVLSIRNQLENNE